MPVANTLSVALYFRRTSEYYQRLEKNGGDIFETYRQKIAIINNVDPYSLKDIDKKDAYPFVTNMDIVAYLVLTHSFYTKEQMKAYKSLNGYKLFEPGFVQSCGATEIGGYSAVVGSVSFAVY